MFCFSKYVISACSRAHEKAENFLGTTLYNTQYLRCKTNGDYDPLQCIDDECFCVHSEDGTLAINPVNPVNITSISNETLGCCKFFIYYILIYYSLLRNVRVYYVF